MQLLAHPVNICQRPCACLDAALNGGIFGWQAKGIEAHRLHHIIAMHPLKTPISVRA